MDKEEMRGAREKEEEKEKREREKRDRLSGKEREREREREREGKKRGRQKKGRMDYYLETANSKAALKRFRRASDESNDFIIAMI
eukprot:1338989-Amorphochlora_amoeboformis.AAC.1